METSLDAFLGGRLELHQPREGYRAGNDPVLLAAATPIQPGQSFVDLGCGAGTLGLCLIARLRGQVRGYGLELDPDLAALAQQNADQDPNWDFQVHQGDVQAAPQARVDWVLSNPPFFKAGSGRASPNAQRQQGRHLSLSLTEWIEAAKAWTLPRGRMGLILHTEQLPEAMAALSKGWGGHVLVPILGKEGQVEAGRVLFFARQGSRSAFRLASPLIMRAATGELTQQARAILAEAEALEIPPVK